MSDRETCAAFVLTSLPLIDGTPSTGGSSFPPPGLPPPAAQGGLLRGASVGAAEQPAAHRRPVTAYEEQAMLQEAIRLSLAPAEPAAAGDAATPSLGAQRLDNRSDHSK